MALLKYIILATGKNQQEKFNLSVQFYKSIQFRRLGWSCGEEVVLGLGRSRFNAIFSYGDLLSDVGPVTVFQINLLTKLWENTRTSTLMRDINPGYGSKTLWPLDCMGPLIVWMALENKVYYDRNRKLLTALIKQKFILAFAPCHYFFSLTLGQVWI